MKENLSPAEESRYKNMITSLVNTAIAQTEGVVREFDVVKSKFGMTTMNTKNIRVYLFDNSVTLDVYINVHYGYTVPHVVCKLQEHIINLIKESTPFKINDVNIIVSGVIFS